jgi:hypothetical protein
MNAVVTPILQPDASAMQAHIEHLFGGFLDGCQDGLVELAWTDTKPDDAGRHRLKNARLFGTDQLDELVEEATRLNATPMCNVYIGAALRHPHTAPFGRGSDSDAWALTALYVDLDDPGVASAAKEIYRDVKPTMVVVTGRAPHTRAQLWWRLSEVITDTGEWPAALRGLASAMNGDPTVTNPSRVMRLAGSIAWPVKEGRVIEQTAIQPLRNPGQQAYVADHIKRIFPPVAEAVVSDVSTAGVEAQHTTNSLGLSSKISDGRERYMRDTVLACLIEFIGENGTEPSTQELFDAAWPQYEQHVDLESRGGRGPDEFAEKCRYTLERFARGELRGLATLDDAIAVYQRKSAARAGSERAQPRQPLLQPPPLPAGGIQTVDFMTLFTEDVVEEPDYIEPGFAGPGNFVLIAGPPKAQKSFLLQEILVAAASGGEILGGRFVVPRPLKVFYLQAEMNRKLLRKRAREMTFLSADEKRLLATNLIISERFHMILNDGGVQTAIATINQAFPDGPPDLIAVDPMANVFDQENENDNAQVMRFLTGRLEAVRQAINPLACLVLVHHSTKKSTEDLARDPFVAIRGGGALRGYYDSAIVIYRASEEGKARKVHFELRGGESPEPMTVELVGGRFQEADGRIDVSKDTARKMLTTLKEAWADGRPLSLAPQTKVEGRFAPRVLQMKFQVPPQATAQLIEQWIMNDVVKVEMLSTHSRVKGLRVVGSID